MLKLTRSLIIAMIQSLFFVEHKILLAYIYLKSWITKFVMPFDLCMIAMFERLKLFVIVNC